MIQSRSLAISAASPSSLVLEKLCRSGPVDANCGNLDEATNAQREAGADQGLRSAVRLLQEIRRASL